MEFHLLGEHIVISPARAEYNQYRSIFQREADQALQRFQKLYQSNNSLQMVIDNVPRQIRESLQPAIELSVQTLVDHNIFNVDEHQFCEMYQEILDSWSEAYLKIYDQYADITMTEEQKDQYRVARRQGRSRWNGGGFGVSGAIKGAATAGALNMVSGAGHMVFNGIAKLGSSIAASSKMNKIFRDPHTASSLEDAVWDTTFLIHFALIDCLKEMGKISEPSEGLIRPENSTEAEAIIKNLPRVQGTDRRRSALLQAFSLDPYQEEWYATVLEQFGDPDGELEKIEHYFGLSLVRDLKLKKLRNFATSLPLDTEERAIEAQNKVITFRKNIHFFEETEETRNIAATVLKFDKEARTVDGIELSTREEAALARQELAEILAIEKSLDYNAYASLLEGEGKIKTYISPIAKKHFEVLHKKRIQLENELRTVDPLLPNCQKIMCDSIEEAEMVRASIKKLHMLLNACGQGQEAEQPLERLKGQIIEAHLPKAFESCYLSEISARLQKIDLDLRTAKGKVYPSREQAAKIKKSYHDINTLIDSNDAGKQAEFIRKMIKNEDFSESAVQELLRKLKQKEDAWIAEERKSRTVDTLLDNYTLVCKTQEEAEAFRPIAQELFRRLKDCGQGVQAKASLMALKAQLKQENLPEVLVNIYIKEIDSRLEKIDLQARTFMGKVFPSEEKALEVSRKYDEVQKMLASKKSLQEAKTILRITNDSDFPEEAKKNVVTELERQKQAKVHNRLKFIQKIVLRIIVLAFILAFVLGVLEGIRDSLMPLRSSDDSSTEPTIPPSNTSIAAPADETSDMSTGPSTGSEDANEPAMSSVVKDLPNSTKYEQPPVPEQEIANAIAEIIPDYIGTYDTSSGVRTVDESDDSLTHLTECSLISDCFDSSQFTVDLDMRCYDYDNEQAWECEAISTNGALIFETSGDFNLPDLINEHTLSIKISTLTYDSNMELFVADITTVDDNPPFGGIPRGEEANRIMGLGIIETPRSTEAYYLYDDTYCIYFDANFVPLNFTYTR